MRQPCAMTLAAALLAAAAPARAEIGLAARFGEVVVENVLPGRSYNLREAARLPFGMQNIGDSETTVVVEFRLPNKAELSPGYEAVPDPSWFKAIPDKMTIAAHSVGFFDLLLSVPDDPALKGRHFQVIAKGRMVGSGLLAVAIENKIRFSVGPGPETIKQEKKHKAMQQLDFDVKPQALYLREVPLGELYDVKKGQNKVIRVANYAPDPLEVMFAAGPWDSQIALPEGYEPMPDPSWIVFRSSHVKVAADAIGQAQLQLRIPGDARFRGKKYAAMVRTALPTGFWLDAPVKVYVETKP